jgi:DNA-binding LytR/AlgR family response regulator
MNNTPSPTGPTGLIAEDETLFRDALVALLREEWPELQLIAVCEDGAAALEAIGECTPDVAFLDIRMPGLTGLDVAAAMAEVSPATRIVFVTAYDQYAIDAFEKGAADYLLKPVARERLAATVVRLKSQLQQHSALPDVLPAQMPAPDTSAHQEMIAALARQLAATLPEQSGLTPLVWLTASSGRETRLIMVDDVIYFQSDHKYTVVMTAQGESVLRTPLAEIVARLDANVFRQIHRGTVVNMRAVASITRDQAGRGTMKLKERPETLTVSLTFMPLFKTM